MLVGHICSGTILMQRGDFLDAREHLDRAIALCDEGHDAELARTVTEDPAVFARVFAAMNEALLGDGARADVLLEDGAVLAARDSPVTYGNFLVLWGRATVAMFLRDAATAMRYADDCMALSAAQGYAMGGPIGYIGALRCHGMALQGDIDEACDVVLQSAAALQSIGAVYSRPMFFVVHAEVSLMRAQFADALASADEGLRSAEATSELWCASDLHRVRGEALAGLDPTDPVVAQELRTTIRIAVGTERGTTTAPGAEASSAATRPQLIDYEIVTGRARLPAVCPTRTGTSAGDAHTDVAGREDASAAWITSVEPRRDVATPAARFTVGGTVRRRLLRDVRVVSADLDPPRAC